MFSQPYLCHFSHSTTTTTTTWIRGKEPMTHRSMTNVTGRRRESHHRSAVIAGILCDIMCCSAHSLYAPSVHMHCAGNLCDAVGRRAYTWFLPQKQYWCVPYHLPEDSCSSNKHTHMHTYARGHIYMRTQAYTHKHTVPISYWGNRNPLQNPVPCHWHY